MNYDELLDKGRDLNNEEKFQEAIDTFESIGEEGKGDIKWHYRYAFALVHMNQFKKAMNLLEEVVLKSDDDYPFGYLMLGQLYYWQGKKVDAFQMVEKGYEKCQSFEPDSLWEFHQVLRDMYLGLPFANPKDWKDSVIGMDFENYDEKADAEYKLTEEEKAKEERALEQYFDRQDSEKISCNLFIKGRLQPKHRHIYEDDLGFQLAFHRLGTIDGGGTLLDQEHRPFGSDINLSIVSDVEDWKDKILKTIKEELALPLGSYLDIYYEEDQAERIFVGDYHVLALGLDGQNLPDKVYEEYSVGDLLDLIYWEFDARRVVVHYFYYDFTNERSFLRFLGKSYEQMEKIVKKAILGYPLAENSIIIDETNLEN